MRYSTEPRIENARSLHSLRKKGANCWSPKIISKPKMKNLLGSTVENVPKFSTKKWIEVHD